MSEGLLRDYELGPEIGRGRFGAVFRCSSRATGEPFAVKSIDKTRLLDPLDRECIDKEAKLHRLAAAGNTGVLPLHAVYEDDAALHLVLDLCPGPDLFDRIAASPPPLPEPDAAALITPLLRAIAACHRRGVAHRDVKPDNVLFDAEGGLRLADFGSAEGIEGRRMNGVVGTAYYAAPEVLAGREYDERVDVWSAGVILYMMLGGSPPFDGGSAAEIMEAVVRANLRFPPRMFRGVSAAAKDLLRRMICRDPSRRLSAEQALGHPWISNEGKSAVAAGYERPEMKISQFSPKAQAV